MPYEVLFHHFLQHSREAVLVSRSDGRIVQANDAAENLYGYSKDELLTLNIPELCPGEELDIPALIAAAADTTLFIKTLCRHRDGSSIPVEMYIRSAPAEKEGVLLGIICATPQSEAAAALKDLSGSYEGLKVDYEEIKTAYEELAGATYDSFVDMNNLVVSRLREEMARKRAEFMSTRDYLTGVLNRRAFESRLEAEINRSKRESMPLGLILCDIDNFKIINDTYGHQIGDVVLKKIAMLLLRQRRSYDFIGRYGGEEFVLCLPGAKNEEVFKIAERLRLAVEKHQTPVPGFHNVNVSASFGVATLTPDGEEDLQSLIRRADDALYQAKAAGKNCVR
jgi:diguanylate cyclase (GGDEF)-like protein/PAS domain S-box-containing protein